MSGDDTGTRLENQEVADRVVKKATGSLFWISIIVLLLVVVAVIETRSKLEAKKGAASPTVTSPTSTVVPPASPRWWWVGTSNQGDPIAHPAVLNCPSGASDCSETHLAIVPGGEVVKVTYTFDPTPKTSDKYQFADEEYVRTATVDRVSDKEYIGQEWLPDGSTRYFQIVYAVSPR